MKKVAFLDRDGVISEDVGHLHKIEDLHLLPGAVGAIKKLNNEGYLVIVVTNQAGIAKGLYTISDMEKLHAEMYARLDSEGAHIDKTYYCPHHPEGVIAEYAITCECRKPGTGMIESAVREFDVDPAASFLVGDKLSDILAGKRMGLKTVFVDGYKGKPEVQYEVTPDFFADDLAQAITYFL